jgi:hypothetical protein
MKKYARMLSTFEKTLKPKVNRRIHKDDGHIKMKGESY